MNIIKKLPSDSYSVLITDHSPENGLSTYAEVSQIVGDQIQIYNYWDLMLSGHVFSISVSPFPKQSALSLISGNWKLQTLSYREQFAVKHVRLMYAMGKLPWNLRSWNRLYDYIITYGPFQVKLC